MNDRISAIIVSLLFLFHYSIGVLSLLCISYGTRAPVKATFGIKHGRGSGPLRFHTLFYLLSTFPWDSNREAESK